MPYLEPVMLELSLSSLTLSHAEASGETQRRYGLRDERDHQPGAASVSGWMRFLCPGRPSPKPSARRPAPHNPPLAAI